MRARYILCSGVWWGPFAEEWSNVILSSLPCQHFCGTRLSFLERKNVYFPIFAHINKMKCEVNIYKMGLL